MATFVDPTADAAEAYEGLRGLAHATRTFEDPADTYRVLGEASGSVRLLRQVLNQLSRAHADHRDIAFTDDRVPAEAVALAARDELHQAADGLDEVADRVMRAHEASGRIAWHTHTNPEPERSRRWANASPSTTKRTPPTPPSRPPPASSHTPASMPRLTSPQKQNCPAIRRGKFRFSHLTWT